MEKPERWIYGLLIFLGGVFLLIFMGVRLIDFFSRAFSYFMLIFFIVLLLYGVILILIGILIMPVSVRLRKSAAFIIFFIGILIVILSFTILVTYSFTLLNIFEILSGIGLIFLGIRLFFPKKKLKYEEKKEKSRRSLGLVLIILGLLISGYYGFIAILVTVSYNLESVFYQLPLILPPFLVGIFLLLYGIYSIKIARAPQESKNSAILPILRGVIILLIFLSILFTLLFTRIELHF